MARRRYEGVVLCEPDFPFVQDGTRQPEGFRLVQGAWYRDFARQIGASVISATGALEQRIAQATEWIVKGFAISR